MNRQMKRSRRGFLAGLGLGPAMLPLLRLGSARAGCLAKPPRRLIALVWTNGVLESATGSGGSFTLPNSMKGLAPYMADIIPVKGLRLQTLKDTPNPKKADSAGHGATPALLTGRQYYHLEPFTEIGGGPSIDAWVAAGLQKQGVKTARATLNLGVATSNYVATWRDSNQRVAPDNDPFHAFKDLFAGAGTIAAQSDPNVAKMQMARASVLDRIKGDLASFKAGVGTDNAMLIDAHLTSIRELEQQLASAAANTGPMAAGCAPPNLGTQFTTGSNNFDKLCKAHMDIAVAAMAADVTRAVTIQLGNEGNNSVIPTWLGFATTGDTSSGVGDAGGMHAIAHRGGPDKLKLDGWYHDQFAYLIGKLKAEKEGDGTTMLDNTVVLVANHMANGGSHSTDNIPWLLAGRCGKYFRTGQAVSVANISHTAVLKEVIQAMGVDPTGFFDAPYDAELPALRA